MRLKHYWHPTPKKWRMLGDGLLAVSSCIVAGGLIGFDELKTIFNEHELKVIIGITFACGVAGKFLTNMFKDSPKDPPASDNP